MLIEPGINHKFGTLAAANTSIPAHWKMEPPRIPALAGTGGAPTIPPQCNSKFRNLFQLLKNDNSYYKTV